MRKNACLKKIKERLRELWKGFPTITLVSFPPFNFWVRLRSLLNFKTDFCNTFDFEDGERICAKSEEKSWNKDKKSVPSHYDVCDVKHKKISNIYFK